MVGKMCDGGAGDAGEFHGRGIAPPAPRGVSLGGRADLPEGNRKDLTEVPQEVKEGLKFVFTERVEDVWKEALIPLYLVKARDRKYDEAEYKADKEKSERSETQR